MSTQLDVKTPMGQRRGEIQQVASWLKQTLISGGAAGNHTVAGIAVGDEIVSVLHYTTGAALANLTSEFTITAANTINNTGGTATTSDQLWVTWADLTR